MANHPDKQPSGWNAKTTLFTRVCDSTASKYTLDIDLFRRLWDTSSVQISASAERQAIIGSSLS